MGPSSGSVISCKKKMSSLTFGPKWVRDLSSGDTGAAAPPNTPPPRKYKLAEFRYGREEMLALVSELYELPLGLKDFEDIINERPVPPLAIIPLSEEEERCQMGGVNSMLVMKMTGRGTPGFRGRGGVRGRGRGRGTDYQITRSVSSTAEEGYNQRPWSETSHPRGGGGGNYHRPLGRGESVDGSVRSGYEPRQRLASDSSYSGRPTEYWRSNSQEAASVNNGSGGGTPTDEGEGWPYKPWTGKKGSADNNRNWRDPKEPEPGEQARPKSWNHSNSNPENQSNSSLPEWCNDDEDSIPGSFDASGQFRSFKVNGSTDESLHETKDNEESDRPVNSKKINNSSNTPQIELKKTNEQRPPDTSVSSDKQDGKTSPKQESNWTPLEDKEKLTSDKKSELNSHIVTTTSSTTTNSMSHALSHALNNESSRKHDFGKKESGDTVPSPKNISPPVTHKHLSSSSPVNLPSDSTQVSENVTLKKKTDDDDVFPNNKDNDDDDELNIEHITSMVDKLGDDSDEEELLTQHQARQQHPTDHATTLDPSIVFAKKAEPGKSINGLQDWIYRDPQGEIQGPFTNDEMLEWFKAGYFNISLLVRRVCDEVFLPLGDVMKLWGKIPFSSKERPPPITNQILLQHQQQQQQQSQIHRLLQQQQQHLQQQQQQQQMREALLQQLQVDGKRPNELGLAPELSVWGDVLPQNPPPNPPASPWITGTAPEQASWNAKRTSPTSVNLQIEEDQQRQAQIKAETPQQVQQTDETIKVNEIPSKKSPSPPAIIPEPNKEDANTTTEQKPEKVNGVEKEEEDKDTSTESTPTKKKNKKKNKNKENVEESAEEKKRQETEQKQKEKEELQRKALDALKQQQQLQQQQKLAEQQRLMDEQNRREEEIRQKQQQQQQAQIQQQLLFHKYQQDQQRKQQQQQQQQQQQAMASTWNRAPPTTSAPSLAEIQRIQERKEAELHEHMKAIHHEQLLQQQQHQQQQQRARWAQQQNFQPQQHRVKSLIEIQAEEAKKALQMQQQQQMKQQQIRQQQQQQQNYNPLPWNAAGQPIHAKPNKNDYGASFWDEVAGITSPRMNGASSNQQHKGGQQNRKGYNDFPPMTSNKSANKRDTKEQEIINRIFQVPTPSSEFISWVERNLPAVKKAIDVPTVVAFLQDIESPYDIHEYMRTYLGDSNEQKQFVREFLERRNKTKKHIQESNHAINMPGQALLSGSNGMSMGNNEDDSFEESKRNKKKKNKMQKVDPNLLGFQCNAAPEMMNRAGEIESMAETMAKGKK